ncbi:MAG: ATP-binding cassette domain-containing protein [Planctomycetia bacterium]|nr:ATP-binding cassette domain-containing protein [Planctomycetia bacterium]
MIHVENLTKNFGPVAAVTDVSFEVEKNEIVGLLGNNGAGKTTLMRMLTTYLPASSGVAKVAGFDVMTQSQEVRKRIGYLPESIPLYPEMRVSEYLDYRAKLKGVDRRQRPSRIDYCLEKCRIREVQRRLLGTLSKGYRQRVGLADALVGDPALLILDEPTDGLDPGQKQETLGLLRELGQSHTIMLSSHLLTEVEALVDRVLIMRRGFLGLSKRITELETDPIIVIEARGPHDAMRNLLRSAEGIHTLGFQPLDDGIALFEVRAVGDKDLREVLASKLMKAGYSLRRLDIRRRTLLDRWNEINTMEPVPMSSSTDTVDPTAVSPATT